MPKLCLLSTTHGNMHLTIFTCEDDDFEWEGHRLTVGDKGDFVLCHKICENAGRHRHIDYCKTPETCESGGAKTQINPNLSTKKDYVSHRIFWERTGFEDPYSANDREEFKNCDHRCIDDKHKEKSYCTQKIFHPILDLKSKTTPDGTGYIFVDGHHVGL
ncbi:hypothetical protein C2G38_2035275 [Gigaspora rosea]|uniref:Uncharacterized protein n=1 Tax=Gigaspora rosea TaxID=44941 RepID=A0A397VD73_9GLOM|nr:hypothetical protein C2G38_2035275 [Gigaspora rosea]